MLTMNPIVIEEFNQIFTGNAFDQNKFLEFCKKWIGLSPSRILIVLQECPFDHLLTVLSSFYFSYYLKKI